MEKRDGRGGGDFSKDRDRSEGHPEEVNSLKFTGYRQVSIRANMELITFLLNIDALYGVHDCIIYLGFRIV